MTIVCSDQNIKKAYLKHKNDFYNALNDYKINIYIYVLSNEYFDTTLINYNVLHQLDVFNFIDNLKKPKQIFLICNMLFLTPPTT